MNKLKAVPQDKGDLGGLRRPQTSTVALMNKLKYVKRTLCITIRVRNVYRSMIACAKFRDDRMWWQRSRTIRTTPF
jgi:hypothetical protein